MDAPPEAWAVETSKDAERWRFFGKVWKWPVTMPPCAKTAW